MTRDRVQLVNGARPRRLTANGQAGSCLGVSRPRGYQAAAAALPYAVIGRARAYFRLPGAHALSSCRSKASVSGRSPRNFVLCVCEMHVNERYILRRWLRAHLGSRTDATKTHVNYRPGRVATRATQISLWDAVSGRPVPARAEICPVDAAPDREAEVWCSGQVMDGEAFQGRSLASTPLGAARALSVAHQRTPSAGALLLCLCVALYGRVASSRIHTVRTAIACGGGAEVVVDCVERAAPARAEPCGRLRARGRVATGWKRPVEDDEARYGARFWAL